MHETKGYPTDLSLTDESSLGLESRPIAELKDKAFEVTESDWPNAQLENDQSGSSMTKIPPQ